MKSAKKRRSDQGAAWSDESEASVMFFKQGEANAAEERALYARELAGDDGKGAARRWWIFVLVAAVIALGAGAAAAHYLGSI